MNTAAVPTIDTKRYEAFLEAYEKAAGPQAKVPASRYEAVKAVGALPESENRIAVIKRLDALTEDQFQREKTAYEYKVAVAVGDTGRSVSEAGGRKALWLAQEAARLSGGGGCRGAFNAQMFGVTTAPDPTSPMESAVSKLDGDDYLRGVFSGGYRLGMTGQVVNAVRAFFKEEDAGSQFSSRERAEIMHRSLRFMQARYPDFFPPNDAHAQRAKTELARMIEILTIVKDTGKLPKPASDVDYPLSNVAHSLGMESEYRNA